MPKKKKKKSSTEKAKKKSKSKKKETKQYKIPMESFNKAGVDPEKDMEIILDKGDGTKMDATVVKVEGDNVIVEAGQ
jgi:FKBP-type peptidyl-prolyl cis-trans isomerase 2